MISKENIPVVHIEDILEGEVPGFGEEESKNKHWLVNVRGANGAGKSTIPMSFLDDPKITLISWDYTTKSGMKKTKPFATWFPTYGIVALGTYFNKTGGMDTFKNNAETKRAICYLWRLPVNIIMEGIMASTIYSTYSDLFLQLSEDESDHNKSIVILSLLPPQQTCLDRIQSRNGGKEIDEKAVLSKWRTVERNAQKFKDDGLNSITWDNSTISKEETREEFLRIVKESV